MEKLALFDFCDTLVNLQTADDFVHYTRIKSGKFSMRFKNLLRDNPLSKILIKLLNKFSKESLNKKLILWQLRGFSKDEIQSYSKAYYKERLKKYLIKDVIQEMEALRKKGSKVYIVSAGYDVYLKYFVEEYKLDGLFCTKVLFKGEKCKGRFEGKDCYGEEKVRLLEEFVDQKGLKGVDTVFYSDSITDLPLLKWANKGILVSEKRSSHLASKHNLEEFIWKK